MDKEILKLILNKLGISDTEIAIPKWGKRPQVLFIDLIETMIQQGSLLNASIALGLKPRSLDMFIKRHLQDRLPKNTGNWDITLVSCINHLKCSVCTGIFPKEDFIKSASNYTCKKCKSSKAKEFYIENIDNIKEYREQYYKDNSDFVKEKAKEWRDNNPDKVAEYSANRRKTLLRSSTNYTSYEYVERSKVSNVYAKRPEGMHVDHIIPLKNEIVSGLHVSANLQYLTPADNLTKSNKFNNG